MIHTVRHPRLDVAWFANSVRPSVVVIAGVTLVLFASMGSAQGQDSALARGEQIVQEKCARCHATGRADASPNPKAPPFREVGRMYPPEHLAEALAEGIVTGDNDMPQFRFNPRDVDAIIDEHPAAGLLADHAQFEGEIEQSVRRRFSGPQVNRDA